MVEVTSRHKCRTRYNFHPNKNAGSDVPLRLITEDYDYWNIVTTLTGLKELIIPGTSSPFGGGPTIAEKDVLSLLCLTNLTSLVIHGAEAELMSQFTHIYKIGPVLL
jgi:hypothetical protein